MAPIKIILLSLLPIVQVNSKSLSCANNTLISMDTLYPTTSILALHLMDDYPSTTAGAEQVNKFVECPTGDLRANRDSPPSMKQTCPFDLVDKLDENRIPAVIKEARCLCEGCLVPWNGEELQPLLYRCKLVTYPMKVLRKLENASSQCIVNYELTYEEIPVGCACAQFFLD